MYGLWEKIKKSVKGQCPKCKSEDIDYGTLEVEGESVVYPFSCNNCEFEGQEYYNLVFDGIYEETEE